MTARLTPTEIEAIRTRVAEYKPPRSNWMGDLDAAQLYDAVDDRAALLADRAATIAGAWRPIAEAPTDESDFLCWDGRAYHVAHFLTSDANGQPIWFNGDVTVWPSHFQLLPAPPSPNSDTVDAP